ncbi:xanthine dehydrogenase family protein molybdopterin-binding subunit, partial [Chloroflexota bacterium]
DSEHTPFMGEGSTSSRSTYNLGNAIRIACQNAKNILYSEAAKRLCVEPDELKTRNGNIVVAKSMNNRIKISELFMPYRGRPVNIHGGLAEQGEFIGTSTYLQNYAPEDYDTGQIDKNLAKKGIRHNSFYSYVAKAFEVAVNTETGEVKVLRSYSASDIGKAINPKMCEQQADGGMCMGIGSAIYEFADMHNGKVLNPTFTDYKVPSMTEIPLTDNFKSFLIETKPHKDGPFGAKGIGEGAMIAVEPAITNAVYDAIGARITEIPLTPEKILKALKGMEE